MTTDPEISVPPATPTGIPATRREFLRLLGLGFLASYTVVSTTDAGAATGRPQRHPFLFSAVDDAGTTFPQSVASGDPTPSGVILWTRLAPAALSGTDPLAVEIALDADFVQIALRLQVPSSQLTDALDYTVRVDLDGQLGANRVYYYRFIYRGVASRTGRARTLPLADDSTINKLTFAVVNCQDYTNGYYGSYKFIAQDPSINFVIHVGDFIYETVGGTGFQSGPFPDRNIILPTDPASTAALGLADYRFLYQTYRSDPFLRAALENFTWMVIWDDHEMANDQYHDYVNDSQGAPDHPYTSQANAPALLRQLKFDSQQAWFEYSAVRVQFNEAANNIFGRLQIYRNFRFGTLVELFLTDERTYRSAHPEGEFVPGVPEGFGARYLAPTTPPGTGQSDPTHTMLGLTQRDAFIQSVTGSNAVWKAWGNEVLLAPLEVQVTNALLSVLPAGLAALLAQSPGLGGIATVDNDSWEGYQYERGYILGAFRDAGVKNLVVLTGDLHTYVASYVKVNYADPNNDNPANVVGVEYMTPAITSSNLQDQLGLSDQGEAGLEGASVALNRHLVYLNSHDYGYATIVFTRAECQYTMYLVDKADPNPASAQVLKRYRTPLNRSRIVDITNLAGIVGAPVGA